LHSALIVEVLAAFFVVMAYFGTSDSSGLKPVTPLAVGLMVAAGSLAAGRLTGGALNPARYFGSALLLSESKGWMVYLIGPCLGGCTSAVLMQFFFYPEEAPANSLEGFEVPEVPVRRFRRSA
jgi:glycerol uptake facilitator-like aquaporin